MIPSEQYSKRKTIRLTDYDYSQPGFYFITICTQNYQCLFGDIADGEMKLNAIGHMIESWWEKLTDRYHVELDCYVVMPNHIHGIVVLPDLSGAHMGTPLQQIARWFKTMTTNEYVRGVRTCNWKPFRRRLWQRNYYEHVVRGDKNLTAIREYIGNNPLQWELDNENPKNM